VPLSTNLKGPEIVLAKLIGAEKKTRSKKHRMRAERYAAKLPRNVELESLVIQAVQTHGPAVTVLPDLGNELAPQCLK